MRNPHSPFSIQWIEMNDAIIGIRKRRGRCVMTTCDPDTLEQEPSVLRRIVREMGGRLGLDCYVIQAGRVTVGDPVELLAADSERLVSGGPREQAK